MKFYYFKYFFYFLFFISLFLGGRIVINSLAMVVIILIIDLFINGTKPIKEFPKLLILPVVFYLTHILSVFYSENTDAALFDLEVKLSFLILPILFGFQNEDSKINLYTILRLYLVASLIAASFMLLKNVNHYFDTGKWLHYMEFSSFLHPSYLSLYFSFSILVGVFLISKHKGNLACIILTISLSIENIILAESKAAVLALLVLFIYLIFKLINAQYRKTAIGISLSLIIVFILFANKIDRFSSISYTLNNLEEISKHPEKAIESTALRFLAWESALSIIEEHPLFGVGNGDVHTELSNAYKKRKLREALKINMNAHNQYLETAVGLGIMGLLLLLALFIIPFLYQTENSLLLQGFILLVAINILVESMFNTQAGVLFIAFFYSFLISQSSSKTPYYEDSTFVDSIQ